MMGPHRLEYKNRHELQQLSWRLKYSRLLSVVDAFVILWAMSGALVLRFGSSDDSYLLSTNGDRYIVVTMIMSAFWWFLLGWVGSRETHLLGHGPEEYKRVLSASFWLFGMVAVVSYALQLDIARGYIAIALPAGVLSLVGARSLVRGLLRNQRKRGSSVSSVLIIGGSEGAEHLARALSSHPMAGYKPVAIYVPGASASAGGSFLPVAGTGRDTEDVMNAVHTLRPDVVALSSGVPLPPRTIRELGWALADMGVKMILAPALTDIAGPRIHTQPVAGLPLIHVSTPNLRSGQRLMKRSFDLMGALCLIVGLSPLFLALAMAVRIDSKGPIFFRQTRVGASGRYFVMYKFRSMVPDAENRLDALQHQTQGNGVLFKLKMDPRVTRVGRFIRRYSLDELPQLFNVVNGTMSLVGPRPPLPLEVQQYESHVYRRLLVRPGLTGLWQVSGRSLLSWDESVRLDLYYVENWSLFGDLTILLRTVRAVLGRHGAY